MKRLLILLFAVIIITGCSTEKSIKEANVSFNELNTGTDISIRAISAVNSDIIWASGTKGQVLKSTDSGDSWSVYTVAGMENADFRCLHAWNDQRALVFAIGTPARAYLTENGGEDWELVYENSDPGMFINSVHFADENRGVALGDPIEGKLFLISTIDGGRTWNLVDQRPQTCGNEGGFAASNTCIQYLESGKVVFISGVDCARFFTGDLNSEWVITEPGVVAGNSSTGIFSVYFADNNNGIVVGGTYDKEELNDKIAAYTNDGGKTWQLSETMPNAFRSCVKPVSSSEFKNIYISTGPTGSDISYDGGRNWNYLGNNGYHTLSDAANTNIIFAAGSQGRIAKIIVTPK